jgi:hypothetical protein
MQLEPTEAASAASASKRPSQNPDERPQGAPPRTAGLSPPHARVRSKTDQFVSGPPEFW